ncbi:MAG TPA: hypothetical protein VGD13_06165 [Xanthobacteraceae bacterium]|jgi:2,4-dienoyl-CoA reductase-like NADH-dependent reductase (Old Yellow Enzyme family)
MLRDRIERFIKLKRMPITRFGREALADPNFVLDLRDGREPRRATVQRVLDYLDDNELEPGQ